MVFQFVFSHCGVERNEDADHAADVALKDPRSSIFQEKCAIPLAAVKAYVKTTLKDSWVASLDGETHRALISKKYTNLKESAKLIRRDEVLLHQLRVGECRLAGKSQKRIGWF